MPPLTKSDKAKSGVTTLVPWYGSNRTNAAEPGRLLRGCEWVGVPFAGGMCELPHITARTIAVNDLHRQVINLARVAADPKLGPTLYRRLRRMLFHPDELTASQTLVRHSEVGLGDVDIDAAEAYFVLSWMGRSGVAGTDGELRGGLAMRWDAGGGDSAVRYRSAVKALLAWRKTLARCTFTCLDWLEFLGKCKDKPKHGLYVDAPWPDVGDAYEHHFMRRQQEQLAKELVKYSSARVVVRFGDCQLIRELYPAKHWMWNLLEGRSQANKAVYEVLLVRNG